MVNGILICYFLKWKIVIVNGNRCWNTNEICISILFIGNVNMVNILIDWKYNLGSIRVDDTNSYLMVVFYCGLSYFVFNFFLFWLETFLDQQLVVILRFQFNGLSYFVFFVNWFKKTHYFVFLLGIFCFQVEGLSYFGFLSKFFVFTFFFKWLDIIINHQQRTRHFGHGLPFGRLRR